MAATQEASERQAAKVEAQEAAERQAELIHDMEARAAALEQQAGLMRRQQQEAEAPKGDLCFPHTEALGAAVDVRAEAEEAAARQRARVQQQLIRQQKDQQLEAERLAAERLNELKADQMHREADLDAQARSMKRDTAEFEARQVIATN